MESIAVFTLVINDVGETENITLKIDYEITRSPITGSVNSLTSDVSTKSQHQKAEHSALKCQEA